MGNSLQDQLLKLGVVDKKQVAKAKKKKHQKRKEQVGKKQPPPVDENKILADQALAKKKERARQLNQEREEKLKKREQAARVKQLIESTRLPKDEKGVAFRFVDRKKVFRIFINQELIDSLSRGTVGIVRLGDQFEVCPLDAVKKISETDSSVVVLLNERSKDTKADEEDPYAGFEVPDDLMW